MMFHSILFHTPEDRETTLETPGYFTDLNLDQVINIITANKQEYRLPEFFYSPLRNLDAIHYRQEVAKDLENEALMASIKLFAEKMTVMRRYLQLIKKLDFKYHKEGWFLEAVIVYCEAVTNLAQNLSEITFLSRGFKEFYAYLSGYIASAEFLSLVNSTTHLKKELSTVSYTVIIKDNWVFVRKYQAENDYSLEVEQVFEKFKQGAVKDYRVNLSIGAGMNRVEAQIVNRVAKLYPKIFNNLDDYFTKNNLFLDEIISVFDREIQFYVSYLDFISAIKQSGLNFCYPLLSTKNKEVFDFDGFDIALAHKRVFEKAPVVSNDFYLKEKERIIVVTGPNQGGKTTFARTFGQLHYLACLGLPVPGREARLYLFDQLFTHFEKEENIQNLRGKLHDDLVRIHTILDKATPNSLIIMNEIFTSTTLKDALFLSKEIMKKIIQLDALCAFVTFIDEMASFSEKTISMVSTVVPENPAVRTYKIVRKPADGMAYAISIAEKYRLTYESIKERIKL
jgi:DNA mismatch repair ATPase MutS